MLYKIILTLFCFTVAVAEDIVVPVMVGQTGASQSFGKNELDAYSLAVEEWNAKGGINGKKITLKVEDTETNQIKMISAFQRLTFDKPAVVLGPTWLDGFQGLIPIAQQKNILLVTPSAAREAFAKENAAWPVTFYHNSTIETKALIEGLKAKGYKKIALIYEQEPFAEMARNLTLKALADPVADIGVQTGDTDFNSILIKLKEKAPDILIVYIWDERSLSSLFKQVRALIPALKLATMHDGAGWIDNLAYKNDLKSLIYSEFIVSDIKFAERFEKRFGYKPILTASNAYDAINAVLSAIAAGNKTATDIKYFLATQEFQTTTWGLFKFDKEGSVPSRVEVVEKNS